MNSCNRWVVSGRYFWYLGEDKINELLPTIKKLYNVNWPNRITIDSNWLCDLREKTGSGIRFTVYYDSSKESYYQIIDKNIKNPDIRKQLKRRALPEPSTRFLYESLEEKWFDESQKFIAENKTYGIFAAFAFSREQIKDSVPFGSVSQEGPFAETTAGAS